MSTLDATFSNDRLRRLTEPRSIAILGIALGMLSLWSALPPWTSETAGVPIFIALLGVAAALWAFNRDERHLATWAVAVSVVGCAAALWLQTRDASVLDDIFNAGLLAATLRFATPLMFAAIGGIFNERSGVINIGLEGMILAGAFFGIWATVWSGSWVIGLVFAVIAGGMLALVLAVFAIHLRADQIVIGTAINFLALGLTGYLFRDIYGTEGTPSDISRIPDVHLGFVKDIPFIGDIFGQLNLMIWLMFVLLVVSWVVLFKTPVGLRLRSVGEHPKAADTVGISVFKVRYAAVVLSGALAALPLDRLHRHLQREHERRPRLHRARRGHRRQVEPVRRVRRVPPVRLRERALDPAPARGRHLGEPRLDAPVPAHADRARRRHRPLGRPRSRWTPLHEAVDPGTGAHAPRSCSASSLQPPSRRRSSRPRSGTSSD
jgi:general nucleoside transport system permease protein